MPNTIKDLIKMLTPPIIIEAYKKLFYKNQSAQFFGVFSDFSEPKDEDPWIDEEGWVKLSKSKLDKVLANHEKLLPLGYHAGLGCLVFIINHLSKNNPNHICNVLDWGGGTGFIYHVIKNGFMNPTGVMWYVIDNERLRDIGKLYKQPTDNIRFYNYQELKSINCDLDIIYINTSLQYINNHRELFDSIINNTKYVVLTRLIAGDNATFITSQNVCGRMTPCKFLNKNEMISYFDERGFKLVFASQCEDFSAFYDKSVPLNLRIPYDINLIFEKM